MRYGAAEKRSSPYLLPRSAAGVSVDVGCRISRAPVAAPQAGAGTPSGMTPAQIRHAYGFDQITFQNGTVRGDGSGQTIAIVDANDDPSIAADLGVFDQQFGLPAPPSFTKVGISAT